MGVRVRTDIHVLVEARVEVAREAVQRRRGVHLPRERNVAIVVYRVLVVGVVELEARFHFVEEVDAGETDDVAQVECVVAGWSFCVLKKGAGIGVEFWYLYTLTYLLA